MRLAVSLVRTICAPRWRALLTLCVVGSLGGCGQKDAAPSVTASGTTYVVGQMVADPQGWIEYTPGDAPLVLIAPHGGTLTPSQLPDRTCSGCVTVNDANTQDLARLIVSAFIQRTGARPHLVVNRLSRRKFDANRDLAEASGGTAALNAPWSWLHGAIDSAKANIVRRTGRGLVIDVHGHAHDVARLELGYLLTDPELRLSDAALASSNAMARTSTARLATDSKSSADRGVALLRGPNSLGALLVAARYPSVPSPSDAAPLVGQDYFNGGYNTARHGSLNGGAVDAIQIECNYDNVRDTAASRAAFAQALAAALAAYLERQYGWKGPAA
jgi:hypothetical protein